MTYQYPALSRVKLRKVISGGQTGADQAGLFAARHCHIPTGGIAPKGWKTTKGPQPDLANYGLVEYSSEYYPDRTNYNVREADVTIRIARHFSSPGELCTLKAIKNHRKKHFDISEMGLMPVGTLAKLIISCDCAVLNVSGNSELSCPGLTRTAKDYLIELFQLMDKWGYVQRMPTT